MIVRDVIERLEDFGDHVEVRIEWLFEDGTTRYPGIQDVTYADHQGCIVLVPQD
jgi:hypothetical protein